MREKAADKVGQQTTTFKYSVKGSVCTQKKQYVLLIDIRWFVVTSKGQCFVESCKYCG
jgi:hypothetical protein